MNSDDINTNKQQSPLDRLEGLLEKQVNMLRNNNLRGCENVLEQVNSVIDEVIRDPVSKQPECREKIKAVLDLYNKLELMLETKKDDANKQLKKLANGQKTLRAYHH